MPARGGGNNFFGIRGERAVCSSDEQVRMQREGCAIDEM
jgi:hypothetical protein